jgi:hypothetical protein
MGRPLKCNCFENRRLPARPVHDTPPAEVGNTPPKSLRILGYSEVLQNHWVMIIAEELPDIMKSLESMAQIHNSSGR